MICDADSRSPELAVELRDGRLSLSDVITSQAATAAATHGKKRGAACSGGQRADAYWHFSGEGGGGRVWLRDVSAVTVLTPTPDLMSPDRRAQGQKATEHPHNLLSRFTDNSKVIHSSRSLKVAARLSGKENCWGGEGSQLMRCDLRANG